MRTSTAPTPTNYPEAARVLADADADGLKIANNTWLVRYDSDTIAVRFHDTNIVIFQRDGRATYRTGGWKTTTTRERLNRYAPPGVHFYTHDGVLYASVHGKVHELSGGITLDATGAILAPY